MVLTASLASSTSLSLLPIQPSPCGWILAWTGALYHAGIARTSGIRPVRASPGTPYNRPDIVAGISHNTVLADILIGTTAGAKGQSRLPVTGRGPKQTGKRGEA